jgi:hypothetical protein
VRANDTLALVYYPFPPYPIVPEFDAWVGLAVALLATPTFVLMSHWGAHPAQEAAEHLHSWEPSDRV